MRTRPPFTTFASSRFVQREAVLEALRRAAARVGASCPQVLSIWLFGSFAHGTPTPRSDADLLVVVADAADRARVEDCCGALSLEVPVPVDLFVQPRAQVEASRAAGRGLAATALRHAVLLWPRDSAAEAAERPAGR